MKILIFGNGNISFETFSELYTPPIKQTIENNPDASFILCEFRGTDTLALEYLKTLMPNVTVLHM